MILGLGKIDETLLIKISNRLTVYISFVMLLKPLIHLKDEYFFQLFLI